MMHDSETTAENGQDAGLDTESALVTAGLSFRFCPHCASGRIRFAERAWKCPDCDFLYFHNVATAAGIFIHSDSGILFLRRSREPARGLLAIPGGFVEPGERAEDAARRECLEETGWSPERLDFLASFPNLYTYRSVPYMTCDLYFVTREPNLKISDLLLDRDESSDSCFLQAGDVNLAELAFPSLRRAFLAFREYPGSC